MPNEAILEIKQVNGLSLSADKAWQSDSNVYLEVYRALVTSGMLADISGNAIKVLLALGLRARVLGGEVQSESLFRHLMSLQLVTETDRGKLFCYATQEDLVADCGFGSKHTLIEAVNCLIEHGLIEKRSRHRQRRRDTSAYVANVYLIRPASSIRKFNAGYTPGGEPDQQRMRPRNESAENALPFVGESAKSALSFGSESAENALSFAAGSAKSALNKKDDDEGDEDEIISSLLARFAARKNDPAYASDGPERGKVRQLLREGYSARQIAAAIDQALDARPPGAKPVRGFGFIVSYIHHLPTENLTGNPAGVLTGAAQPAESGRPTGASAGETTGGTAGGGRVRDDDPLSRAYLLLQAASIQGIEGVENVRYDLPGIRLGLRRFVESGDPFSADEVYQAVLAAVSRGIQPERLVGYAEVVLENARKEEQRERSRMPNAAILDITRDGPEDDAASSEAHSTSASLSPPDQKAQTLWQSALSELELQMTRATFNAWLRPATLLAWESVGNDGLGNGSARVTIGVPNPYVREWLEHRLFTPIQRTLSGIAGQPVEIAFQVDEQEPCDEPAL